MGGSKQIVNSKAAFGDPSDHMLGGRTYTETEEFFNASSVGSVKPGHAVVLSSNNKEGKGATATTVNMSGFFVGIAVTSGTSCTDPTVATSLQPQGCWFRAVTQGLVYGAFLTSGTVPGDVVGTTNSTVSAPLGGYLGTATSTNTAGSFFGVAGWALTSGSTLAITGIDFPADASHPRGVVLLRPALIPGSTI
jgi:hypothetical protein